MKVNFNVDNKQLAWIEAYSMAISGAAVKICEGVDPVYVHSQAVHLADLAVATLEERYAQWSARKS